jgi:hypothetical protein
VTGQNKCSHLIGMELTAYPQLGERAHSVLWRPNFLINLRVSEIQNSSLPCHLTRGRFHLTPVFGRRTLIPYNFLRRESPRCAKLSSLSPSSPLP